jgi:riboflavin synthase
VFSGLVKGIGRVVARTAHGTDQRLAIELGGVATTPLAVGGSIAVNGVCLTAVTATPEGFSADVSAETLAVTTLGRLASGQRVNLEPPLQAGEPLDGHLVTGHVDGVGEVVTVTPAGRGKCVVIALPSALARYVATKGSIAVDGVSLTVNAVSGAEFTVNVIPHTLAVTAIGEYRRGTAVNIEVDMLARYLERLLLGSAEGGIDREFLRKHGYARDDR